MTPETEILEWLASALADLDPTIAARLRCEIGTPMTSSADVRGNALIVTRLSFHFDMMKGRDVVSVHSRLMEVLNKLAPKLASARIVDFGILPVLPDGMMIDRRGNGNMTNGAGSADVDHLDYEATVRIRPTYRQLLEAQHAAANG